MQLRVSRLAGLAALAPFLASCASLNGAFDHLHTPKNKIYVGVRGDLEAITNDGAGFPDGNLPKAFRVIGLIDLPFSLVCDTILLPYTIPHTIIHAFTEEDRWAARTRR